MKNEADAKLTVDTRVSPKNPEEYIRSLCLMDDIFMAKCFEDNIECTELVVRIILERDDLKIRQVHAQHSIKNLQGRSVILDIFAVDTEGRHYNIEIQRSDDGAHVKRARYNSSLIDANISSLGENYNKLPESYVIFITERDVFKSGLPIYHIERVVNETEKNFGDGSHIIYVNGENRDDSPIGLLMRDFFCTNPKDMNYTELSERTSYFKNEKKGEAVMSGVIEELLRETKKETKERVQREMSEKVARKLLMAENISYEKISEYSSLPLDEVKRIAEEIKKADIS